MNSELPSNNVMNFDAPRIDDMNAFLNKILQIKLQNSNINFDHDFVYHQMCFDDIKPSEKDQNGNGLSVESSFEVWREYFQNKPNIHTKRDPGWRYFFQFLNGEMENNEFIKLYVPMDYEHLEEGAKKLFSFLGLNNIYHMSKIGMKMRSDNVIVRLDKDDTRSAVLIIDYLNADPYFKNGMNKTNPFVPTIDGIGYMVETGISYNGDIAELINRYTDELVRKGVKECNIEDFYEYVKSSSYTKPEVLEYLSIATGKIKKSIEVKDNKKEVPPEGKISILYDALYATYQKYGSGQMEEALHQIINNSNYSYITNGGNNGFRNKLMKNLTPDEVKRFAKEILSLNAISYDKSDSYSLPRTFCTFLQSKLFIREFESSCMLTYEKYGRDQLNYAITAYFLIGNADHFTRFKNGDTSVNYRDKIKRIDNKKIPMFLEDALRMKGINMQDQNFDMIIDAYVDTIVQAKKVM